MPNGPIRVLHVVPNMQQGGLENYIMNMYRNIDRSVVQFDFLEHYSTDRAFDSEIRDLGGFIHRIPFMEHKTQIAQYLHSLNHFFKNHDEYQIVHGHMGTTALFYLSAAQKNHIPHRLIHAHESSYIRNARGYVRKALIQQSWRNATELLACSQLAGRYYYGHHPFRLLKNAINTKRFTFNADARHDMRNELGIDENTLVLCHIGRFSQQKNQPYLIDVLEALVKSHPDVVLIMVGEGDTKSAVQREVSERKLTEKVRFICPSNSPEPLYSAADIFLLPSVFEGLPLTGVEAQCNGLPCIFSSAVTQEVKLTPNAHFATINQDPSNWARLILNIPLCDSSDRAEAPQLIRQAGYDVAGNTALMQRYYLQML